MRKVHSHILLRILSELDLEHFSAVDDMASLLAEVLNILVGLFSILAVQSESTSERKRKNF